jgi:two-component system, NarL family, invasion response regulator UvrY
MVRIILADQCPIVRRGVKQVFREFPQWQVRAEANDISQLCQLLDSKACELLILETWLRGPQSGLPLLEWLLLRFPRTPILVYTFDSQEQFAVRVLRAGASGYVHKDSPENELIDAVRAIARGEQYIDSALKHKLALLQLSGKSLASPVELLSARERQVFDRVVAGAKLIDIAAELGLSPKTVSSYRARIFHKIPLASNADLVRLAATSGAGLDG